MRIKSFSKVNDIRTDCKMYDCEKIIINSHIKVEQYEQTKDNDYFKITGIGDSLVITVHKGDIFICLPRKEKKADGDN